MSFYTAAAEVDFLFVASYYGKERLTLTKQRLSFIKARLTNIRKVNDVSVYKFTVEIALLA